MYITAREFAKVIEISVKGPCSEVQTKADEEVSGRTSLMLPAARPRHFASHAFSLSRSITRTSATGKSPLASYLYVSWERKPAWLVLFRIILLECFRLLERRKSKREKEWKRQRVKERCTSRTLSQLRHCTQSYELRLWRAFEKEDRARGVSLNTDYAVVVANLYSELCVFLSLARYCDFKFLQWCAGLHDERAKSVWISSSPSLSLMRMNEGVLRARENGMDDGRVFAFDEWFMVVHECDGFVEMLPFVACIFMDSHYGLSQLFESH